MDNSNTAQNSRTRGRPFTAGDKRINRKGRPKSFDALRTLAQQIAHEAVTLPSGARLTVTEAILRQWAQSKDPRLQQHFIEVAYGKVPDDINLRMMKLEDLDKLTDEELLLIASGKGKE